MFTFILCSALFITDHGTPTEPLQELLGELYAPDDTLEDIVAKTNRAWLQVNQGQKERTDLVDTPEQSEKRRKFEAVVSEMGLFEAQKPKQKNYAYGAVYGAFVDATRASLNYLIEAWKEGTRFDTIVFFTGARPLRKQPGQEDDPAKFANFPENAPYETEYDMCKIILEEANLPEDMKVKIVFVNAKAPPGMTRPSRKDCFEEWLKTNPPPGTLLAASHPLYWSYQQLAVENSLPQGFTVDTCCNEATEALRSRYEKRLVSLLQDNIAKCLYEINVAAKKN